MKSIFGKGLFILVFICFSTTYLSAWSAGVKRNNSIDGKVICIDPGHGGTAATDSYRVGPSGEREEWVNLRVALLLGEMLEGAGAKVVLTRTTDTFIPLAERSKIALENKADIFISIHHNATADPKVNFPIIYFHGSAEENQASVTLGKEVAEKLVGQLFKGKGPYSLVSDFTIFSQSGSSVLRGTYGIPGIIGEASFFTSPKEEKKLKQSEYNQKEAQAYFEAIASFFASSEIAPIAEKKDPSEVDPFKVFQEAERMRPEAKAWKANFLKGKKLLKKGGDQRLVEAFELLTLSARSFPDSYVAKACHELRVEILKRQNKVDAVKIEEMRIRYFYP
ncbi:N-acetylmuramoyl-L-alanine amidase [Cyclobacterium sp. 1_MG-2023]|uniref:N-acetylmuramoyl-L-alanine amidase family protein n=1 Tax=Cyclobacterium sp. 1_MG-2023 TaxID=3062681 RepID=UPI0026E34673|nr:N-acetylmuramoyl-L-alanine amidase [Cyclobacterium sp. 1_MG-2023]MDO6437281.1 N-acetylmuramoyl-L-alanine amidase [Cyclobacterium sp. 1_MG-2023]